jgi:Methyltransferase domain
MSLRGTRTQMTISPLAWLGRGSQPATQTGNAPPSDISMLLQRFRQPRWHPGTWLPSLKAARILWRDYGHFQSVIAGAAVDRAGDPLPWYTYPAIDFLAQLDFSEKSVFEYGSGMSTLFWARMASRVVSVEDEDKWFLALSAELPANAKLIHEPDLAKYPDVIRSEGKFDVIVVDGPARGHTRLKCSRAAVAALREGGLVILDNSDWLPESSNLLRDSGLLEVDFTGFAPICGHVQTTSLYFQRAFNVRPSTGRQPMPGHGARLEVWERPPLEGPGRVIACDGESFRGVIEDVPFEFATPDGQRNFRALNCLGEDDGRYIAILDVDRDRVLVIVHRPSGRRRSGRDLTREIARIAAMSWEEYRVFIAEHERRCYVL